MDGPHSSFPRVWSRTAFNVGSEADAESIAEKLQQRWPPSEYGFHIHVIGGAAGTDINIRVWNSTGIQESGIAYASDHAGAENPIGSAALEEVEYIVDRLKQEGKLKA